MRKTIAVILFFTFTAAQYARQVSYLECKLVNYFSPSAVTCDCEKLLLAEGDGPSSQPLLHNHIHVDEWYNFSNRLLILSLLPRPHREWAAVPATMLVAGTGRAPDRPPRLM